MIAATTVAVLLVVWPGHDVKPMSFPSFAMCQTAARQIRDAAKNRPGFRAWCVAEAEAAVS